MPSLFIVNSSSDVCPKLYVSQQTFEETLRALRSFPYSHVSHSFVFEPRIVPYRAEYDPSKCAQLSMVARLGPSDLSEHYRYSLSSALDELPPEQGILEAQRAIDLFTKKLVEIENKLKTP